MKNKILTTVLILLFSKSLFASLIVEKDSLADIFNSALKFYCISNCSDSINNCSFSVESEVKLISRLCDNSNKILDYVDSIKVFDLLTMDYPDTVIEISSFDFQENVITKFLKVNDNQKSVYSKNIRNYNGKSKGIIRFYFPIKVSEDLCVLNLDLTRGELDAEGQYLILRFLNGKWNVIWNSYLWKA